MHPKINSPVKQVKLVKQDTDSISRQIRLLKFQLDESEENQERVVLKSRADFSFYLAKTAIMSQKFKLVYYNFTGRAELARYMFAVAGQEFEDVRFEREDWPKYKDGTPFGQVPVLEVTEDGKTVQIAQSLAIARFLGKKFGLYGKNDLEMAEIDM